MDENKINILFDGKINKKLLKQFCALWTDNEE
jgi:hypothetical protein